MAQAILLGLDALSLEPENSRPRLFLGWQLAELQLANEALAINQPIEPGTLWLLGRHDEVIAEITVKASGSLLTADDERNLGQAYAAIGEYEKALPLLETAWAHSGGRVSALSAWFQGDAEAALYALEKSVRVPFFMPANLHYLQNHPGYAPIRDMREAWLRDERQAFLDVVCQGNPYAAVWQPQPKTCEEYQPGP